MQLKTTTEYAIRMACFLASEKAVCPAAMISSRLGIPLSYIPKIAKALKDQGILSAIEGMQGGYSLKRNPDEITLGTILRATEKSVAISSHFEQWKLSSSLPGDAGLYQVLQTWQATVDRALESVTIADLLEMPKAESRGAFFAIVFLRLKTDQYRLLLLTGQDHLENFPQTGSYAELIQRYTEQFVDTADQEGVFQFLHEECLSSLETGKRTWMAMKHREKASGDEEEYAWTKVQAIYREEASLLILSIQNLTAPRGETQRQPSRIDANQPTGQRLT